MFLVSTRMAGSGFRDVVTLLRWLRIERLNEDRDQPDSFPFRDKDHDIRKVLKEIYGVISMCPKLFCLWHYVY